MFITNDAFQSPLHKLFGDIGDSYWTSAEIALHQIWFLMALRIVDRSDTEPFEYERTLLLSDLEQLAHFLTLDSPDLFVRTAYIVTPGHVNGSTDWAMDELFRIWDAEEPNAEEQHIAVYETKSGKRYSHSLLGTPVKRLKIQSLRFELPSAHIGRN